MDKESIDTCIEFIRIADRLKTVTRKSLTIDELKEENSAEHSWHAALMAMVFAEGLNVLDEVCNTAIKMLLVHDLVEIECGDTFAHGDHDAFALAVAEERAATRLFLNDYLDFDMYYLWYEFEEGETPAAKFANAMDRLQPFILNMATGGRQWRKYGVTAQQVKKRMSQLEAFNSHLYKYVMEAIDTAEIKGMFNNT
jgi:putative hydrolase of HD superfamily